MSQWLLKLLYSQKINGSILEVLYQAISRKVKIAAGITEVMLGVTIIADRETESDETFSLVISNPIGQGFPEGVSEITATHTIVDDD